MVVTVPWPFTKPAAATPKRAAASPPAPPPDEAAAVARVLAGEREAFAFLVRRYQDPVYRLLLRRTPSPEDAEDLAQEAFLRAYRALEEFDPARPFAPWLFRIALNLAIQRGRSAARHPQVPLPEDREPPTPEHASPREQAARSERQARVAAVLAELPASDRDVLELFYEQDLPISQIAETLGKSPGAVRVALHRARQKLRERMKDEG